MKRKRLIALDSLRGIAAILVMLYHLTSGYDGEVGWPLNQHPLFEVPLKGIGVAIFFVISGFVISLTLERSPRPIDFAISRFARLFPPFWTCLLVTTAFIGVAHFNPFHLTTEGFFVNLTMLNGMTLQPYVDPSYWTLTRELLFYFLLSGIYFTFGQTNLTACVLAWIIASAVYNLTIADDSYYACTSAASCLSIAFNALYGYLFASGIMLYRLYSGDRSRLVYATLAIAILSGGVSEWPTYHAVAWATSAKAAVYALIVWAAVTGRLAVIQGRVFVFLGSISYALYLLHQVIGTLVLHDLLNRGVNVNLAIAATIAFLVLLATGICYGIERPAQRSIRRYYSGQSVRAELAASQVLPSRSSVAHP